jgi:NAD(P)-dependent dehydrogenase (short-subunit alcohol dehydrogenase family)
MTRTSTSSITSASYLPEELALLAEAGRFARCDVREQADNEAAVAAVTAFGGLDVAFLNAGVSTTNVRLGGPAWDLAAYRRAFGINGDGSCICGRGEAQVRIVR